MVSCMQVYTVTAGVTVNMRQVYSEQDAGAHSDKGCSAYQEPRNQAISRKRGAVEAALLVRPCGCGCCERRHVTALNYS